MKQKLLHSLLATCALAVAANAQAQTLKLNDLDYFEARGTNVLVYSNLYDGGFCDEKLAGIEIIQRGERIATGGGVRLMNTPEQWDIYSEMTARRVLRSNNTIEADFNYKDYGFTYTLRVSPRDKGALIQVVLNSPVPETLVGKAGFNLEFFPASYFGEN